MDGAKRRDGFIKRRLKMIATKNLSKIFQGKNHSITAVNNIDFRVAQKEFVLIKGPSGSGKSSLLFILGGLSQPSAGQVFINQKNLYQISAALRNEYIANTIGFVFQSYHLFAFLNVLENILIVNKVLQNKVSPAQARRLAAQMGLSDRLSHKPSRLSAGEKQRVALARALVKQPAIILADEPTGNLDNENSVNVLDCLKNYQENGGTVLMVSHQELPKRYATKILKMQNGSFV